MPRGHPTSPETAAEARRLYESTSHSEPKIAVLAGLSHTTLRRLAAAGGWTRPGRAPKEPPRQDVVAALRARIEQEIIAAEAAMGRTAEKTIDGVERISRSLASLVRTLRELAKYDEEQSARAARAGAAGNDAGGDAELTDLDAFRDALADRLERLRLERGA